MSTRRLPLPGLFAVLLALMAQLGMGSSMPRMDPVALAVTLCHAGDTQGGAPSQSPGQHNDCLICPLCAAHHASVAPLVSSGSVLPAPVAGTVLKAELPPPSTAPPAVRRPPSQPRAPPAFS